MASNCVFADGAHPAVEGGQAAPLRKRLSPRVYNCEPVNPNATPQARELLKTLCAISGKVTLTGMRNYPGEVSQYSDRVAATAGKHPAVWGSDIGFCGGTTCNTIESRPATIREAIRQHAAGSIITLMWHAAPPIAEEPVAFNGTAPSVQTKQTEEESAALLKPGTEIHQRWVRQVDAVAEHLKKLRDAKVPLLRRPYHEMNGTWFWWRFREGLTGLRPFTG